MAGSNFSSLMMPSRQCSAEWIFSTVASCQLNDVCKPATIVCYLGIVASNTYSFWSSVTSTQLSSMTFFCRRKFLRRRRSKTLASKFMISPSGDVFSAYGLMTCVFLRLPLLVDALNRVQNGSAFLGVEYAIRTRRITASSFAFLPFPNCYRRVSSLRLLLNLIP